MGYRVVVTLLAIAATATATTSTEYAEVLWDGVASPQVRRGLTEAPPLGDTTVVRGSFREEINGTGWDYLELQTNPKFHDELQAYWAGYLEGLLTHHLVYQHMMNTMRTSCEGMEMRCGLAGIALSSNKEWIQRAVGEANRTDEYWHHVKLFYDQLEGLTAGYQEAVRGVDSLYFTLDDILLMNTRQDLLDYARVVLPPDYAPLQHDPDPNSGSALVKLLPDSSDVLVGHATWASYQSMLRIQKKYTFSFRRSSKSQEMVPGVSVSFSSYPGLIHSSDDFYVMSSGLVTTRTSIDNQNSSLWSNQETRGDVLQPIRTVVANRLADDGASWTSLFGQHNSGTRNSQWLVVDYERLGALDGVLWVLEQLPGHISAADRTSVLRDQSYWASYGLPSFPEVAQLGALQTDKAPARGQMLQRGQAAVRDSASMLALIRYNDYLHDPLSECAGCDPSHSANLAVAPRGDLNPANGTFPVDVQGHVPYGATDGKVTNAKMARKLEYLAESGPTRGNNLPAFCWSTSDMRVPHEGQPDLWGFEPGKHSWKLGQ